MKKLNSSHINLHINFQSCDECISIHNAVVIHESWGNICQLLVSGPLHIPEAGLSKAQITERKHVYVWRVH